MTASDVNDVAKHALRALINSEEGGEGVGLAIKVLLDLLKERDLKAFMLVSPYPRITLVNAPAVGLYSTEGGNRKTGELNDGPGYIKHVFKQVLGELEKHGKGENVDEYLARVTFDKLTVIGDTASPTQAADKRAGGDLNPKSEALKHDLRSANLANAQVTPPNDGRWPSPAEEWLASQSTFTKGEPGRKSRFYAVKIGVHTGVFAGEWAAIERFVSTCPGQLFLSFDSKEEAVAWMQTVPAPHTVKIFEEPLQGILVIAAKLNHQGLLKLETMIRLHPGDVRSDLEKKLLGTGVSVDKVLELVSAEFGGHQF